MVMKDKLVKFGHKRGYYAARKTFVCFLSALCIFSIVAIPTYIASKSEATVSQAKGPDAEDEDTPEIEENEQVETL